MLSGLVSFVKARRIESAAPGAFRHKSAGIPTKAGYMRAAAVDGFRSCAFHSSNRNLFDGVAQNASEPAYQ